MKQDSFIRNKHLRNFLLIILLISIIIPATHVTAAPASPSGPECQLYRSQQKLWIDHVSWTHSYIVSAAASLEDQKDVLTRLLKNQEDIGNSIKPFYGEEAGNKLTGLLKKHIELAGSVLQAAKENNKSELEKYNTLWYQNADQIAAFLSSINPNYSEKELKDMYYAHLQFVTDQVVARLTKNWNDDITAYDKGEDHMVHFSEILSAGIVKQFPDKFI